MQKVGEKANQDELRNQLRTFTQQTGIRQTAISEKLGKHKTYLANFICGNRNISPQSAKELVEFMERTEELWKQTPS